MSGTVAATWPPGARFPDGTRRTRSGAAVGQDPGLPDGRGGGVPRSPRRFARTTTRRSRPCWASGGASSCPTAMRDFGPRARALSRGMGRRPQVAVDVDKAIVEVGKTGWTLPDSRRQGRCEMALRCRGPASTSWARTRDRSRRAGRHTGPCWRSPTPSATTAELDPSEDRLAVLCPPADKPARKEGRALLADRHLASPRVRWVSRSPMHSPTASRRAAIMGYNFRLLYAQGPAAPGGALNYLVNGRMLSFAAIAWPGALWRDRHHDLHGQPRRRHLPARPRTRDAATGGRRSTSFNPEKGWEKADMDALGGNVAGE